MLRDITILNYRVFKDFSVDGLARVNLLVGKNNSGKTSFLEAIYLLVHQRNPSCLLELLGSRGEYVELRGSQDVEYQTLHVFHGHYRPAKSPLPPRLASEMDVNLSSHRDSALS